jgi:uncharacterized membrane protein YfcA
MAALARAGSYYLPSNVLMVGFGVLLVVLSVVLYESHEHWPSIVDTVAEKPELPLLAVMHEEYEPRTRVMEDTHRAAETPPSDTMGGPAETPEELANGAGIMGDSDDETEFHLEWPDVGISALGGVLAGLVGIAIGELTQTMLALRRRVPLKLSTGTSALVLHVTIISALLTNIALLRFAPSVTGKGFTVPFGIGAFVAFGCLFGGQAGAFLNNRLSEERVMQMLIAVYFLVGLFVVVRTVFFGGAAH